VPKSRPPEERFWEKVDKSDTCWLWTGGRNSHGYGIFDLNGRAEHAHRAVLILTGTILQPGQWACHRCDVRLCVRPAHLYVGDATTNNRDTAARNPASHIRAPGTGTRISAGLRAHYAAHPDSHFERRMTHCSRGHAYDDANTRWTPAGKRDCRACGRIKAKAHREAYPDQRRSRQT
jgi:hypothetical protein